MQILSGFCVFILQRLPKIYQCIGYQFGYQTYSIILLVTESDKITGSYSLFTTNVRQKAKVPLTKLSNFKGHHYARQTKFHYPLLDKKESY